MKKKIHFTFFSFLFFLETKAQCAMCRAVLESGEDQAAAEGINDGIMFLMVMPYLIVAIIAYIVYKTYNSSKKSKTIEETL